VVQGDFIFVAGTTGANYATGEVAEGAAAQTRQTIANIEKALSQAGSSLADVVRVVIYAKERALLEEIVPIIGETFRDIRPANTTVIAELVDPELLVEIEVTALRQ